MAKQSTLSRCPISTLPFELMAEIFVLTLPTLGTSPGSSEAPLLLGSVCTVWRKIALATPSLWAALCVRNIDTTSVVPLTGLWLSRARGYPLSIAVETANRIDLLETICRYSTQWQDVVLSVPLGVALSQLPIHGALPLLKKLEIRSEDFHQIEPVDEHLLPLTVFRDAPLLREVQLRITGQVHPNMILLPWEQLTRFTGSFLSTAESLYILFHASSLSECTLLDCWGGLEVSEEAKLLPLLKNLRLGGDSISAVVQRLTLPNLEFLEVSPAGDSEGRTHFALETLRLLVLRSMCPLREVHLRAVRFPVEPLLRCLGTIHTLEILEISRLWDAAIVKGLHTSGRILPRLRSLIFSNPKIFPIPYDDMISLLFSRSRAQGNGGSVQLERFAFTTNLHTPLPDVLILDRFKAVARKGIHIHLGPPEDSWV
ncbi:hypothetical protein B0H16DRAFT_1513706 [Mycena metata]|uniref:F-box domain-containing protein n=1 Tax=Mycena metata TaxID=1033252 RepID=A0AAD7JVW3_9AGAR|nr:hypothetical protein B0H16DRAFT_1513706 [Mycena metata]